MEFSTLLLYLCSTSAIPDALSPFHKIILKQQEPKHTERNYLYTLYQHHINFLKLTLSIFISKWNISYKKLKTMSKLPYFFSTNHQQKPCSWAVDNLSAIINRYWHWQSSQWGLTIKISQDSKLISKQLLLLSSAHCSSILYGSVNIK